MQQLILLLPQHQVLAVERSRIGLTFLLVLILRRLLKSLTYPLTELGGLSTIAVSIFGIESGIECCARHLLIGADQRDSRGQINKVAGKEFQVGVDSAEFQLA
ncbi:MAG: hypothetical protein MH213_15190 [Marinobacter sp.]|nr:hypothetical protein [Marinobacter sp.]